MYQTQGQAPVHVMPQVHTRPEIEGHALSGDLKKGNMGQGPVSTAPRNNQIPSRQQKTASSTKSNDQVPSRQPKPSSLAGDDNSIKETDISPVQAAHKNANEANRSPVLTPTADRGGNGPNNNGGHRSTAYHDIVSANGHSSQNAIRREHDRGLIRRPKYDDEDNDDGVDDGTSGSSKSDRMVHEDTDRGFFHTLKDHWWKELIYTLLGAASLWVIFGLFWQYNNKPLSNWNSRVKLNSVIAVLSQFATTMLLSAVCTALGQYIWRWFGSGEKRYLTDLESLDGATRGAGGSIKLFFPVNRGPDGKVGLHLRICRYRSPSPFSFALVHKRM